MAVFSFNPVTPHPLLAPYIDKMSVFESSGRLPDNDRKLIVPNANFKLTLTFRNGISARVADKTFVQNENKLSLTGLIDSPVHLDPQNDTQTGTIIIEFTPQGVYRLFQLSYADVKNQIVELPDLLGSRAEMLQSRLAEAETVSMKIRVLQDFLLKQLEKATPDPIYDYCLNRIAASNGLITVAQLEKATGYSARWLHKKFLAHLGTGPKNFSEIIRFKQLYREYSTGVDLQILKGYMYDYYHDQSHFIKAFKRFTGYTPTELQSSANELATKHYNG